MDSPSRGRAILSPLLRMHPPSQDTRADTLAGGWSNREENLRQTLNAVKKKR